MPPLCYPISEKTKGGIRMELHSTLQGYAFLRFQACESIKVGTQMGGCFRDACDLWTLCDERARNVLWVSGAFRKLQVRLRRRLETTLNQLTDQFSVARVRARTHWGVQTRMSHKLGACLLGAFLNQSIGRPLMKLRDLVLA